jgi:hypothetical protein
VVREVLRQRSGASVRQEPLADEDDETDRRGEERDPDEREREVPEASDSGVVCILGGDDVHRRPREREQRSRVRAEREGQEELRGRLTQSRRADDHDREQRRDRPVDADQCREDGDEKHHEDEQPPAAAADVLDQLLTRPGGDPGRVEALADDEDGRDEQHHRIAEAGERLVEVEDARRPQSQRRAHGDDRHREPVEDEDDDDRREQQEGDGLVAQRPGAAPSAPCPTCARATRGRAGSRSGTR